MHCILSVTAETSKWLEVGLFANRSNTIGSVPGTASGSDSLSSESCEVPLGATADLASSPTYSVVVQDSCNTGSREWITANRKKSAKAPARRQENLPCIQLSTILLMLLPARRPTAHREVSVPR